MRIRMELLSDTIFGNGMSVPGGEDISIQCDAYGFPYYRAGTFKGIFREELIRYLGWCMEAKGMEEGEKEPVENKAKRVEQEIEKNVDRLLGKPGDDSEDPTKLVFSDFKLSQKVRDTILAQTGEVPVAVTETLTHVRTFTRIEEAGVAKEGTLRQARCVNKGLIFYSELRCDESDEELVRQAISLIKWVGSMRNRGFGRIRLSVM